MTGYNILSSGDAENDYPLFFPETNLDLINSRSIPPEYSYTRNSSATYVGDDGLIKTAAINEPRFEFDVVTGEYKGLLIEESRTNQLTYSNTFDVDWTDTNITRESTSSTAPDGTNTALRVLAAQNNATIIRNSAIGSDNTRTFSIFLRRVNGSGAIQFTFNGGSTWTTIIQPITSTWSRILVVTNTTNHRVGLRLTTQGDSIELWGSQLEIGPSITSYIPTVGSTITRQPDQLVLNRTLNPQGAFYIESNITLGTSLVADNGSSTISPPQGTKSALFYNTSRTLFMSSSITPFEGNFNVTQNLNRVSLGFNRLNNSNYINGHLKKFMYYGSPVTEDNLRSLTGNTRPTFRFGLEQIITDGLVLWLDAGNPASYPGSGTTWFDLSGFGNNGTLFNGVGYNSDNGGSLVFDGVDNGITLGKIITTTAFTVSTYINQQSDLDESNFLSQDIGGDPGRLLLHRLDTGKLRFFIGGSGLLSNSVLDIGVWYNTTFSRSSDGTAKIFLNGNEDAAGTLFTNTITDTSTFIGYFPRIPSRSFPGKISQVSIYNRALTASEIQQNFIATRSRFGI
jgi:hypothetical protein